MLPEKFWNKVRKSPDCWEWIGAKDSCGYGKYHQGRQRLGAHRVAYESLRGPVPEGLELDHLCRNRACVNPDHLEPVTHMENMRRAAPAGCRNGHPFDEANTYVRGTERRCRACNRAAVARYKARRAGVA